MFGVRFFEFGYRLTVAPETYNPISVYRRCIGMYCTALYEPKVEGGAGGRLEREKRAVAGNHPSSPAVEQRNSTSGVPPGAS